MKMLDNDIWRQLDESEVGPRPERRRKSDDLDAGRGIMLGVVLGVALWCLAAWLWNEGWRLLP